MKQLEESLTVLSGYTERMEKELSERRDIQEMLDSYIWHHQCLLHGAKERQRVSHTHQLNIYYYNKYMLLNIIFDSDRNFYIRLIFIYNIAIKNVTFVTTICISEMNYCLLTLNLSINSIFIL